MCVFSLQATSRKLSWLQAGLELTDLAFVKEIVYIMLLAHYLMQMNTGNTSDIDNSVGEASLKMSAY